jgi:hypothetical protein
LFDKISSSFFFFLISILSLSSEILSSTYSVC